jgi:hypothetical protein
VTENGRRVGYVTANAEINGIGGVSVITPDGTTLTVPVDGVGFGVQLHSHPDVAGTPWEGVADCFVTGAALLSRVRLFD